MREGREGAGLSSVWKGEIRERLNALLGER